MIKRFITLCLCLNIVLIKCDDSNSAAPANKRSSIGVVYGGINGGVFYKKRDLSESEAPTNKRSSIGEVYGGINGGVFYKRHASKPTHSQNKRSYFDRVYGGINGGDFSTRIQNYVSNSGPISNSNFFG